MTNILSHLPRHWHEVTSLQKIALWQMPLIAVLSLEIGLFMWLFWAASWGLSFVRRWWLQAPILAALIALTTQIVPVRSADFFILMLVILLPFTWRLDEKEPLSPAGLCPTIFVAGSVFIFQSQFIVLLGLVAWLLAFLLWFTTALTGFRLSMLSVRWLPILAGSAACAAVIVLLFTFIPRLSTGFIPSFATATQQIGLTDELSPGGMSDLLASEDVAFRAIPASADQPAPSYWRVFSLAQSKDNLWQRAQDRRIRNDFVIKDASQQTRYQILADTHDLSFIPVPGFPGSSAKAISSGFGYNRYGEALLSKGGDSRQVWIDSLHGSRHAYDYPASLSLSKANPRLQDYGRLLRERLPDEQAFIDAIMTEFGASFIYDTKVQMPDENALDAFFFDIKTGFCSYFATTLATILRAGGLEAHVLTGYMGGEWNSFGNYWLVKQSDAHAWVEVRRQDGTWQRLDPTLEAMQLSTPRFSGLSSFGEVTFQGRTLAPRQEEGIWHRFEQAVAFVDSLNLRVTLAIMNYGDDTQQTRDGQSDEDNFALLLAAVGLAVTMVFVIYGITRLSARPNSGRPAGEKRLERLISAYSSERLAGESLLEHVAKIAPLDERASQLATQLAKAIYQNRFALHHSPASKAEMKDALKQIQTALKQAK